MLDDYVCGPLSSRTITDYNSYCRETVVLYQINQPPTEEKIDAPEKIVQINESQFGEKNITGVIVTYIFCYYIGLTLFLILLRSRVEGHLVLGMIEDG